MGPLTDRMRTCAAAITASQSGGNLDMKLMSGDAARLLTEAANLLDVRQAGTAGDPPARQQDGAVMYWTSGKAPQHTTRHFDDGSKHCLVRGNDAQAMRSTGRGK